MQLTKEQLDKLIKIFEEKGVCLAYLFGSAAKGEMGPLSDYDFAFYAGEKDSGKIFDLKMKLAGELSRVLETDRIDVVALNTAENPELKYQIIKDGNLIYEQEPFRLLIEPKILSEYFDFHDFLLRHNLTKAL